MGSRGASSKTSSKMNNSSPIARMEFDEFDKLTDKQIKNFISNQSSKTVLNELAHRDDITDYNNNQRNITRAQQVLAGREVKKSNYASKYIKKENNKIREYKAQVKDNSDNAYNIRGNKVVHGTSTRDPNSWTKEFKTAKEAVKFVNEKIKKYGVAPKGVI